MSTSIPNTEIDDELIPRTSSPHVWIGFIFAGAYLLCEIIEGILVGAEEGVVIPFLLLVIVGWLYWIWCIHRIHRILAELTNFRYPVEPGAAAVRHIFPVYNLFWVFYWTIKLSNYLNARGRVSILSGYVMGAMLLLSLLLRYFDGAIGMASLFGVTMYISSKVEKHVQALKGVDPDELPPLPDPQIFSKLNN